MTPAPNAQGKGIILNFAQLLYEMNYLLFCELFAKDDPQRLPKYMKRAERNDRTTDELGRPAIFRLVMVQNKCLLKFKKLSY